MQNTKIKVLVVEDDTIIRMGIVAALEDAGFVIFEAANASEALCLLVDNLDIQAMFTDIDMPGGMDGLKLAAAVRDRWPPIQIIITSGVARMTQGDMPVVGRFFSKPYNAVNIASTLREMVSGA